MTARIVDEQPASLIVRLWYRDVSTATPGNFVSATMTDNGLNNDRRSRRRRVWSEAIAFEQSDHY